MTAEEELDCIESRLQEHIKLAYSKKGIDFDSFSKEKKKQETIEYMIHIFTKYIRKEL